MNIKSLFLFLIAFLLFSFSSFAGDTGKLSGKVTDAQTHKELLGINVVVEKTKLGAATDIEGKYIINNLSPGVYNVNVSGIGYQKTKFTSVKIASDFTTTLDIELEPSVMNLEPVVIVAAAPLIRKDLTSSQTVVDGSVISSLPVESIDQILTLQAGITKGVNGEIHIRGGRSNEIDYTINGVSIQNPYDNTKTIQISTNAIQELSVVSGTFNAEYGNALSGVVNTITKEGTDSYHLFISSYTGDFVSNRNKIFTNIGKIDPFNNLVTEGTFGGPVPLTGKNVTFFLSGRYNRDNGYLDGIRQNTIYDSVYKNPFNANDIKISSTGDGAIVPMNTSTDINATGKITFKPLSTLKINYDIVVSKSKSQSYDHNLKYVPDANPTSYDLGLLNSVEITHALSKNTFYSVRGSYNFYDYKYYLFPLLNKDGSEANYYAGLGTDNFVVDPRYQPDYKMNTTFATYTFNSGGTINNQSYLRTGSYEGKFDLTSQLNDNHEVKLGLQLKIHDMNYEAFDILRDSTLYLSPTILGITTSTHDLYNRKPMQYAAYIQDKMEFETIILNVGLRMDYFNSKAKYSENQDNPSIDLVDASPKYRFSPRIGMSFPITDKGIIHFSYGHFYQLPPFSYLYANANFKSLAGVPTYGNANLNPEMTVTYEMGLQQQLTNSLAFTVTGFYKDVRDLLALQQIHVSSGDYYRYVNKDYGNIKGVTFSLIKRRSPDDILGISLDYTYQVAEGNDVNAASFYLDQQSGRQSEKIPVPLSWDQTHTLNGSVSVGNSHDWNITFVGRIGTGLPYTPQEIYRQIYLGTNSERRPSQITCDLLAEKSFNVYDYFVTVFLKIFNLFDTLNEQIVYNDTGRSTYTLEEKLGTAQATDLLASMISGAHSATEYFVRPDYYTPPREVRFGLSIEF